MGISRNTGPGRPLHIRRQAASTYSGMRSVLSTRAANLVTGLMIETCSADISAPRSKSPVFDCPPTISSGVPDMRAASAAVTELVTPGPRVTAATPGMPESREVASAMKQAAASWRAWTIESRRLAAA